jgi:putative salt-induced outer membrane protein
MSRQWLLSVIVFCPCAVPVAFADDAPPAPPAQGWSGKGELGYVMSRGNTDTDTANTKLDLADVLGDWKQSIHFEGLYGRSGEVTSAERWAAMLQSNYQFTPRAFVFGALHYLQDEFSGFQYQGDIATGLGYKFLDTSSDKLTAQIGAGYRRLRPETLTLNAAGAVVSRVPGESAGNAIGTAGLDYAHIFNAITKITEKLGIDSGSGNTELQNDLALVVNMSKRLALSAGVTVQENTEPPAGLKKVNTLTTLNLVYAFNQ